LKKGAALRGDDAMLRKNFLEKNFKLAGHLADLMENRPKHG